MSGSVIRRLKPEEEEFLRKREELTTLRAALAERELEIVDLRSQLGVFEGRYLRQLGTLYAELDEWKARIYELQAKLNPSSASSAQAEEAREQARQTSEDAHSPVSESPEFAPSSELRRLFREVARRIHPDFCKNDADRDRRTRLMTEANRAYRVGDADALQGILDEYQDGADAVEDGGIGAELIRIIRQISQARARVSAIEQELSRLRQSEIALLKKQSDESEQEGRDLLAELALAIREQIKAAEKEHKSLAKHKAKSA